MDIKSSAAIVVITLGLSACNSTNLAKSAIDQVAMANGIDVEYDVNSAFGKGLPTKAAFNRRYGRDNCAVKSYMELRRRYISVKDALSSMAANEGVDQPGLTARLVRVDLGSANLSLSPEMTNTFYVDELEGSQGFGNYAIAVSAKGFGCKIISYEETKL